MPQSNASPQDLIDAMQREKNPVRRSLIITQLGAQGVVEAVEPLIKEVLSNDYQSGAAISALGSIGDPRAVSVLIQSFRYQTLGWVAKDALVRIGTPALEPLFAALRHENPDTRFLAVRTLAELRDPSTLQPLQTIAEQDSNATNRQAARRALKSLLLDHLDHESADVRLQAVRGLQRLGDARTIEPLQALITSDPNDEVIYAARAAIIPLVQGVECRPL